MEKQSSVHRLLTSKLMAGFIHSMYAHDPNGIPIEFSYNVETVDIRMEPQMRDESPSAVTLEGADPKLDFWPEMTKKH